MSFFSLSFLGLDDETEISDYYYLNLENCPLPLRYEKWADNEKTGELPPQLPVADNRFKVFMHSQKPKWAANNLGQLENYGVFSHKNKISRDMFIIPV